MSEVSELNEYKNINISEILNYEENPRHDIASGQHETLKMLIEKVGAIYMFNLAQDIYLNGLISANIPVVVWNNNIKKYIAYEGNRRIACIKILDNPSLLDTINKSLKEKIEKLKMNNEGKYTNEIQCFVTDKSNAFFIMERIHAGEDKGRGLKAWSPKEKQVFLDRTNESSPIELVITQMNKELFDIDYTDDIGYTNIQRFFRNRAVKKALEINDAKTDIDKEKLLLINFLLDKALKKSKEEKKPLSRLFDRARDIEDFFLPLISSYKINKGDLKTAPSEDRPGKDNITPHNKDDKGNEANEQKDLSNQPKVGTEKSKQEERKLSFNLIEKEITSTNIKTINLLDYLQIENKQMINYASLDISSEKLFIQNYVVQPNSEVGNHIVIFTYYLTEEKNGVYWQDSLQIKIFPTPIIREVPNRNTVLSVDFVNKFYDLIEFEHSKKIKTLMKFLSEETLQSSYAEIFNITSRMFLEYSFRLYASEIMRLDNQEIDNLSKSLPGFIGNCCNKIDQETPETFVRHITLGKKEAISKIDLLQKSVHYYDVDISPLDIQNIFNNLNIYLDYMYSKLIKVPTF